MNSVDINHAEKIGGWYAVAASALAILLLLLIVVVLGIIFMNYHPFQLIKDILYIYNYGFLTGSALALILSFIIGKSAGRSIANESENSARIGVYTGLSVFTPCILIGLIMLFLQTNEANTRINVEFQLRSWAMTFLFIFIIGFIPVAIIGYVYSRIVKQQVKLASYHRSEK